MAAVTQLSIPPLIKTTALVLEFRFIFPVVVRASRAWILMGLAKESQRVREAVMQTNGVRRLVRPAPKCICEAGVEVSLGGRRLKSSAPELRPATPDGMEKTTQDFSCDGAS